MQRRQEHCRPIRPYRNTTFQLWWCAVMAPALLSISKCTNKEESSTNEWWLRMRFKTLPRLFPVAYITLLLIISATSFNIGLNERLTHKNKPKKGLFYEIMLNRKTLEAKSKWSNSVWQPALSHLTKRCLLLMVHFQLPLEMKRVDGMGRRCLHKAKPII